MCVNPFHATGLFLYPLKRTENLWFLDVFRGHRKIMAQNGLITRCEHVFGVLGVLTARSCIKLVSYSFFLVPLLLACMTMSLCVYV